MESNTGYRSDVLKAAYFPDGESAINARIMAAILSGAVGEDLKTEMESHFRVIPTEPGAVLYLHLGGVKWYDSYDDVAATNRFFDQLTGDGYETMTLIIGEELDDMTYEHNGETTVLADILDIHRSIVIDCDLTISKPALALSV